MSFQYNYILVPWQPNNMAKGLFSGQGLGLLMTLQGLELISSGFFANITSF